MVIVIVIILIIVKLLLLLMLVVVNDTYMILFPLCSSEHLMGNNEDPSYKPEWW